MRIRTTKPEFWKSEDIAALDWDARLIFIGLWSYVDDNSVGRDNEKLIAADLFPLEDDPRETLARLSRGLRTLFHAGLITRYLIDGRPYLSVVNWEKHQKIDRPNKARYMPPTCENAKIRETIDELSRESRETPSTVVSSKDQGNRVEKTSRPPVDSTTSLAPAKRESRGQRAVAALNATAHSVDAFKIAKAYAEWMDSPVDGKILSKIAVEIDSSLQADIPPGQIANGLRAWHESSITATSQIGSFIHKAGARSRSPAGKPTKKALGYAEAAEALIAEFRTNDQHQG